MPFDDAIRVSDAERDSVVAALSDHHAAGRLTLSELQERVEAAYRSVTRADLHLVLADLPAPTRSAPTPALAVDSWPCATSGEAWTAWLVTGVICLTVWVLTSIGSGEAEYFWPMWVIGPWALVMAAVRLANDRVRTHG